MGFVNDWSRRIQGLSAIELTHLTTFQALPISGVALFTKSRQNLKGEVVQIKFCPFCGTDLVWRAKSTKSA
jgi:hypothetical protein